MGLRRGAAAWDCAGVQRGAAQGLSSVGLRWSAARGCVGAQQRGAALECSMGLCRGAAAWGCVGVQRGAAQGRSSVGLRWSAAWGCARVQRGAA